MRNNRNLSHTTLNSLDYHRNRYDRLDQQASDGVEREEDDKKRAYLERCQNELVANRHTKYVNAMLDDRNITREDAENLKELKDKMANCKENDRNLFKFDIHYIDESMDFDEYFSVRRAELERSLE